MDRLAFPAAILFALSLPLAGCDSPSPRFAGAERHEVRVGGSTFTVFRKDDEVEVYRTSMEVLPRLSVVLANAQTAIVQGTGCAVREGSLTGDPALIRARLNCTGAPLPPLPEPTVITVECEAVDQWTVGGGLEVTAIDCAPR